MTAREPGRPSADDLLARYHLETARTKPRGRLRVFLGAAPGVGKTYAMLNEARRLKADGYDIVAGFIESHGRAETEAQIGNLEVVSRVRIPYRGVIVEEMDTEAILARKPQIVLVDELAHTNAPGSPRAKRFEDVGALRVAGIDVITTVNIQHLEGLQDVVVGITGVAVRETLPDRVLADADVQLVDLPTEALIDRLQQGKVYPPQRAQQALQHFFRPGNLTALREMALRRTAEGVEDALTDYMHEHRIDDIWPAAERVLVLVDGATDSGTVLRNAWRLAGALRCDLVAVAVTPPGGLAAVPSEQRAMIEKAFGLADDLGMRHRVAEGAVAADAIADVVHDEHATLIVMRHARETGWRCMRGESLVDALLERLDNVDIHLVEAGPSRTRF